MPASLIALAAAVCAVVAWTAKAVAIGWAGGLGQSPAEGPLFLVGLVAALTGAGALGAAIASGSSGVRRVLAGFGVVAGLLLVTLAGGAVASFLQPEQPSWVWGEVNLWVSATALLAAVVIWRRFREAGSAPA